MRAAGSCAPLLPGTPPTTVIPLDTSQALTFRRTFMSALFQQKANRYTKEMPEIFWRTSPRNKKAYKTSRLLFDFGALLQHRALRPDTTIDSESQ